jgi:hypothetical protein
MNLAAAIWVAESTSIQRGRPQSALENGSALGDSGHPTPAQNFGVWHCSDIGVPALDGTGG